MSLCKARFFKTLFGVFGVGVVAGVGYHKLLRPWHLHWGLTEQEIGRVWPGDELVPNAPDDQTHAITIDAPASAVWPWILQIGQDRAGFYSYTLLENLFGCEMRNADHIVQSGRNARLGTWSG
ncbi:MAG TPA: hypothetical protein VMT53_25820 [Terriglobales bacterium]|nr:hypothetical protein [Terriglobales bacterium]